MSHATDPDDLPIKLNLVELKEQLSQNGVVLCPVEGCNQDFKSLWGLKYHVRRANHQDVTAGKFKCEQCNQLFQSRVALREHRSADHSGSEGGSPLTSPRSRDVSKDTFHFESEKETTTQLNTEKTAQDEKSKNPKDNSNLSLLCEKLASRTCTENNESPATNEMRTSNESEGNLTLSTGIVKRKRGRPRKNADNSAKSGNSINSVLTANNQVVMSGATLSPSAEIIKTTENSNVYGRRTSTRLRTPRKNIFSYEEDTTKSKRKRKEDYEIVVSSNPPKKRGRKPKTATAENVMEGSNSVKTPVKKRGRKRKCDTATNDADVVAIDLEKARGKEKDGAELDNGKNDTHEGDVANEVEVENDDSDDEDNDDNDSTDQDSDDDDDDNDDGDEWKGSRKLNSTKKKATRVKTSVNGKAVVKPAKRGRKKKKAVTEATRLIRLQKSGQTLNCENKGCRAKFTSALGYISHMKVCGIKEEEREKFTCEICGKEYISFPGLTYHMKAKHTESEPVNSDHSEDKIEEVEPEVLPNGRTRRKAASRALSKVHRMTTDQELEEIKLAKNTGKEALNQLVSKIKGRGVSKEQEDKWTEALKTEPDLVCPCMGCSETFQSVSSIKAHLVTCEKAFSYKCLACGKIYLSLMTIQKHIRLLHVGFMPKGMEKSDSSDVDFKVVSAGESEDDSDTVEIEEIEESGSDVNDNLQENAEEIFVWDDKRRKHKKPQKKRRPPARTPRKDARLVPFGSKDSESYTTTESWRKQEHRHKDLFPNLRPSTSYWPRVQASDTDQYLPEATTSPLFQIRRKEGSPCIEEDIELPLFGSTSKDQSSVCGDVTFNVGGPVWAMDWSPVPDSTKDAEQFLAISTHRSYDEVHKVHKCFSSKGLIQLWNVGQLRVDSASSGSKPTLSLGIAHNFGVIWDISWCPSGTWEPSSSDTNQTDGLSRLGVMAVACSDGMVRILSIPWPSELLSAQDVKDSDSDSKTVIFSAVPHAVLIPCSLGVAHNGESGQAWRAKWFPCSMHEKIATGFSDGTVAIWNLLTESPLLKETMNGGKTFRLAPFLHISTNSSVVKDLAWCPECPDYLATGSYDRLYKVWNVKSPSMPVAVLKRGIPHEIHWPYSFGHILSCEDDAFQSQQHPCVARYFTFQTIKDERLTTLAVSHNCTIWSVSMSEWSNMLVSGDAAGEVVAVSVFRKKRRTFDKFGIYRVFLEEIAGNTSPKEQEETDVIGSEETNTDSVGEGKTEAFSSSENVSCSNKEMKETNTSEERTTTDACAPNKTDSSTNNEMKETTTSGKIDTGTVKEKKTVAPPRTSAEVFEKHRLVFYDVNALEFQDSIDKSDPDFKRLLSPSTMQSISYENSVNPQAIHKVRFNPNKQSYMWLATGGAAGLARLHLVKQITT